MTTTPPEERSLTTERRRAPRYRFVASAEVVEKMSGAKMNVRVTELSLYGCYLDMPNPLPSGARIFVRIFTGTDFFEAEASVIYSQANLGVGLSFHDVNPYFLPTLKRWLHEAMQETLISKS
ncbi:MAG: PilZ domain-containing protein [Candidatus Acidiferrum sp.]